MAGILTGGTRPALPVLLALLMAVPPGGCKRSRTPMEVVNKGGARPFVVAFRSYAGSRVSLVRAASDLLTAWGAISEAGGNARPACYDDAGHPEFVASATLLRSDLAVQGMLQAMAAVEERLGGPQFKPAPFLKMDLLWVQGVEVQAPELSLPAPSLFDTFWANHTFTEAGKTALLRARAEGRERQSTVERVLAAGKTLTGAREPAVRTACTAVEAATGSPTLLRHPKGTTYSQAALDDLDALATAGDLLLFAESDVARGLAPKTPGHGTGQDAPAAADADLRRLRRQSVRVVEVALPAGTSAKAAAQMWVDALARFLAAQHFRGVRTVVYVADAGHVRGAVLGQVDPAYVPHLHPGDALLSKERRPFRNASGEQVEIPMLSLDTRYLPP